GDEAAVAAASGGLVKTPDRRAWVKESKLVAPIEQLEDVHVKVIAGIVGVPAALQFRKSLAAGLRIGPEDVLLAFAKNRKRLEQTPPPELVLLNERVAFWLNGKRGRDREADT